RPCQRCIKRDLAASCTDGIRKRAKYLQDSNYDDNIVDSSALFGPGGYPPATGSYGFGSEAVNLEYSILSNMLSSASTESLGQHSGFADIGMIDQSWQQQPLSRTSPVIVTPGVNGDNTNQRREISGKRKLHSITPENVYANVKKPFSYKEGFHYLVNWVRER
ncbi:10389_t:CDS:2, partial [Acaulospora colombiana]